MTTEKVDLTQIKSIKPSRKGFQDRLTTRLDIYWQTYGEDAVGVSLPTDILLETSQIEPYIRKKKVTEKPTELTFGDLEQKEVGYILLVNTEGTKLIQNPTISERYDIRKRIVTVNGFEIHPYGTPFFGRVPDKDPVIIRCLHGTAVIKAYIFPR